MELLCKEKRCLLPVTALEFCFYHRSEVLISGEGPLLKVFSESGQLLCVQEALPFKRVHGIRPTGGDDGVILVFGQKAFCVSQLAKGEDCTAKQILHKLHYLTTVTELSDWILDVLWLMYKDPSHYRIAFVTAHNAVLVYSVTEGSVSVFTHHSEINCILYSAYAVWSEDEPGLTLASGTVFNKILLWSLKGDLVTEPEPDARVKVLLTLSGHEGVIFSIKFSNDRSKVISASDDRTVRVWSLLPGWRSSSSGEEISCSLTLYGHTARVWDARLLPNCIVSIGEDVTCRVWDLQGQCQEVVKGHKGRSIWSMAINHAGQVVATGGGDCSVRTFHLYSREQSTCKAIDTRLPSMDENQRTDTPRSVALSGRAALCLTNNGYLYSAVVGDDLYLTRGAGSECWREVHYDAQFSGYCVMSVCEAQPSVVAIGNLKGHIKLLTFSDKGLLKGAFQWTGHHGKVFSLNWATGLDPHPRVLLFSCGPEGSVVCWSIAEDDGNFDVSRLTSLTLPPSKHRWISAVMFLSSALSSSSATRVDLHTHVVLCGDRKGSVHVYHCTFESPQADDLPLSSYEQPVQTLRLHGPNGVTSIVAHGPYVYTAGRDGYCRKFSFTSDGLLTELTKFKPVKGMDWIEKLVFFKKDLLVLGFHTTNMVLHSTSQNRHVMQLSCGGGHRSYGTSSAEELISEKRSVVVFIKQSSLCFREVDLCAYFTQPILQRPFVGREAVSMTVLQEDKMESGHLVAIGSEDCTLSLVRICPDSEDVTQCIKVVKTLQGHISSVRALSCSVSGIDKDKKILFSGGARASLKVWSIGLHAATATQDRVDVTLDAELFLHDDSLKPRRHRRNKSPCDDLPPECRAMSLSSFPLTSAVVSDVDTHSLTGYHYVAVGCSDAMIRQYIYDEKEKRFTQLSSLTFHNKCLLCVGHFFHRSPPASSPSTRHTFLYSTATDGRVAIWSLDQTLCQWTLPPPLVPPDHGVGGQGQLGADTQPCCVFEAHQSGVNAISLSSMSDGRSHLVSSVGDDNALTVSQLKVDTTEESPVTLVSQCTERNAHSSTITGVQFLNGDALVTTSVDQRLNVWSYDPQAATLKLTSSFAHDVADATSLQVLSNRDSMCVVFCGVGIQYCSLTPTLHSASVKIISQ